jgi:hypothetical protein
MRLPMVSLVAPVLVSTAVAACSTSSPTGTAHADAGQSSPSEAGSDAKPADGGSDAIDAHPRCDAGPPADVYAPSQPFECNESLRTLSPHDYFASVDPSVKLAFDLVTPPSGAPPTAAVVLLAGGVGLLDLTASGIGQGANNFCVRTRQSFAGAGFVVAVPDAPSDDHTSAGLDGVRASLEHAEDLSALVQWLRKTYEGIPVWVVGTSRGTISTVDVAVRFPAPRGPDHIVLTSSITVIPKSAADQEDIQSVPGFEAGEAGLAARVPILMIDNALDQCGASPPLEDPSKGILGAEGLAEQIGDAKHFVLVEGGTTPPPDAGVCGSLSYHGFYGLEGEVVPKIVHFIRAH